jgi:flagellar hook assembly protein FlgD
VVVLASGVEEPRAGAVEFALLGSSQSPSGALTAIRYSLAKASPVDLRIYSTTGKLVRTLRSGIEPAGLHQVVWDRTDDLGQPAGRGTYFCRMTAGSFRAVSKLTTIE